MDAQHSPDNKALEQHILSVFSSPGSMNASFLKAGEVLETSTVISGLDLASVREAYLKILGLVGVVEVLIMVSHLLLLR